MNYQFYTHFEIKILYIQSGMRNKLYSWWLVLQNFALKKSFIPKVPFFYSIDVCGNGYLRNIVTTSLFMTLVKTMLSPSLKNRNDQLNYLLSKNNLVSHIFLSEEIEFTQTMTGISIFSVISSFTCYV